MPIVKSQPMTIIDNTSSVNLEVFLSSNHPITQILKSNGALVPSWVSTPLILTPTVYIGNSIVPDATITWKRRSGSGSYTDLVSGESVTNGVLKVNQNLLSSDPNGIITYKCTVTYKAISRFVEMTYFLSTSGKDGTGISIKGTAYISGDIGDCVIGENYTIYSDKALTTPITNPTIGDSYIVSGHMFVYSGAADDKFNCVGDIQGVGIDSITGPVSNGIVDTYTIHYTNGTISTYDIINGKPVYVTYHNSTTQPEAPTGSGNTNGWHTNPTSESIWMSQKIAGSISEGQWGTPIKMRGSDGKGITSTVISYQLSSSGDAIPGGEWINEIPSVGAGQYLWTKITINYTDGTSSSGYSVGGVGESGDAGKGIKSSDISYQAHISGTSEPTDTWSPTIPDVPEDQYLWTKTVLTYTDDTTSVSYSVSKIGKSGSDGVTFNIYSETGTVLRSEDESVTLRLQKVHGATDIVLGGTTKVQWSKFVDGAWINTWKYDSGDTENVVTNAETLLVKHSEVNGTQLYKCVLTYNGKTYNDIVTITDKTDAYYSQIIAIGGNVLTGGDTGVVAYATIFRESTEEDKLLFPIYDGGTIPIENTVYYVIDGDRIVTKRYSSGSWTIDDSMQQDYVYTWFLIDRYTGEEMEIGSGKVVYISHDMISTSGIVQCRINDLSVCTETFTDSNDPIISNSTPLSTSEGQLWYNTEDKILYVYSGEKNGYIPVNNGKNRTYISAPINFTDGYYYQKGDLWIVDEADSAYTDVSAGSLLIATNDFISGSVSNWKERLANDWESKLYYDQKLNEVLEYQNKISAYFDYQADGLKIGAVNTEFYTKITPYDLGFYQGVEKVAYINNNKMYNTSLEVSDDISIVKHRSNAQPNPQKPHFNLGNYRFIIEENNSMSIAYALITAPQPSVNRYTFASTYIDIHFNPWSTNNAYGYVSAHNNAENDNIVVRNVNGDVISTTKTRGNGYIRIAATGTLPNTVTVYIPERAVSNKGVANNTLGYDTIDMGNDAITLTLTKI